MKVSSLTNKSLIEALKELDRLFKLKHPSKAKHSDMMKELFVSYRLFDGEQWNWTAHNVNKMLKDELVKRIIDITGVR